MCFHQIKFELKDNRCIDYLIFNDVRKYLIVFLVTLLYVHTVFQNK